MRDDDELLPSDLAVRLLETMLDGQGLPPPLVDRREIMRRAQTVNATAMEWWVDRVLGQLCERGYVRRVRGGQGVTTYCATDRWGDRRLFLRELCPSPQRPTLSRRDPAVTSPRPANVG